MARIDLRENEFMERFVGQGHIDSNDVQFWHQLLSCSFNFTRVQDPKIVDKTLDPYLVRLTLNNSQSLNIGSMVRVFLDRVARIKSPSGQSVDPYYVFQSFNALYLIRSICKSYIENLSEEQLIKAFRTKVDVAQAPQKPIPPVPPQQQQNIVQSQQNQQEVPPIADQPINSINNGTNQGVINQEHTMSTPGQIATDASSATKTAPVNDVASAQEQDKKLEITPGTTMLEQFVSTLIAILVDTPLTESTYLLQVESINSLLVLLSVQMYSTNATNQSFIYKCLMQKKCSIHALILTKTLLGNFLRQQQQPQEAGSIIIGLASGLWKVLTLGYGAQEEEDSDNMPLLAKQSLLLLNILTNHFTTDRNPYREAMISCQDSKYNLCDPEVALANANNDVMVTATTSKSVMISNSIKIDFQELYDTICKYLHSDQVALLLYLLLHSNKIFRPYILTTASSNLDKLVLPLLKILYSSMEKGSHHVYMVLIIFIILSEEKTFNEAIHKITVRGVPWYRDRILGEISLGSLTALIIIRSCQYNTFRIKDKFLHTNLFATLGNLSNHFHNLHPYVCQRLVDLLERLSKRYLTATKPTGSIEKTFSPNQTLLNSSNPLAKALATDTQRQDFQDASSIELDSTSTFQNSIKAYENGGAINLTIPDQQLHLTDDNKNFVLPPVDIHSQDYLASESSSQQSPNSSLANDQINISMEDTRQDIVLIEDVIRMILEVINNCLATQLKSNPDLIYTLLYKRNVFSSLLSSHQSFYNMVINVERILTFFYNKIEAFERPMSVIEIKDLIQTSSKSWNFEQGKDPDSRLLFHYVEDEQPEEFFIPYIWTRIYYSSGIVWNSRRIVLFNPGDL